MDEKRVKKPHFLNRLRFWAWKNNWSNAVASHDKYLSEMHEAEAYLKSAEMSKKNAESLRGGKVDIFTKEHEKDVANEGERYELAARGFVAAKELNKAIRAYKNAARAYRELVFYKYYGKDSGMHEIYREAENRIDKNLYRLEKVKRGDWRGLGHRRKGVVEGATKVSLDNYIAPTTAIIGLLGAILFLSPNVTGNVIGSLNQTSSNWIGLILFVIGIIGAFAHFRLK